MLTTIAATVLTLVAVLPFEVRTVDGQRHVGGLTAIDAERVVLSTDQGEMTVPLEQVLALARPAARAAVPFEGAGRVTLIDGTSLVGQIGAINTGSSIVERSDGVRVELPTSAVEIVRFRPTPPELESQWTEILSAEHFGDVIVVDRGESIDYLEGTVLDVTGTHVHFEYEDRTMEVKRDKIAGLLFRRTASADMPAGIARVSDRAGSVLAAAALRLVEDRLQVTTRAGVEVQLPMAAVARLDFSLGKVQYVGDLEPREMRFTPFFDLGGAADPRRAFFAPRMDQNLEGEPLRLAGRTYDKGLAIRSRTQLVYRLPDGYRRLVALAGIDDAVRPAGHVRLTIRGDEQTLTDVAVGGRDEPIPIDVDIEGVRTLTIVVDFGDDMDVADHLDLCDARITK